MTENKELLSDVGEIYLKIFENSINKDLVFPLIKEYNKRYIKYIMSDCYK